MKKRFFNALLLGAVLLSTNAVTSCKDYDDDINNLQSQIDKLATAEQLKSEIATLSSTVASAKAEAIAEANKALEAAKNAQATADKAATKEQLEELKKAVEAADAAAKKAQADLVAAKANLEELIANKADKTALDEANAKIALAEVAIAENKAAAAAAQATADAAATAANGAQATADAATAAAAQALADAKAAIADAKAALEAEIANKADKTALEAAENRVSALETLVGKLGETYAAKTEVTSAVAEATKDLVTKSDLATAVEALNATINSLSTEEVSKNVQELQKQLEELQAIADKLKIAYSTMITDIQLFHNSGVGERFDNQLRFMYADEVDNDWSWEMPAEINKKPIIADAWSAFKENKDNWTFKKGHSYVGEDSVLVRVSPANAQLIKDNVSLINSQGKDISDIVEVTSVEKYDRLLKLTRAADSETGLWVVKFKPVANEGEFDVDAFLNAAVTKENSRDYSIAYAVAVKNSDKNVNEERCVTSEYALSLYKDAANDGYNFTVNETSVNNIRNRYYNTENRTSTYNIAELSWIDKKYANVIVDGNEQNAADRYSYWYNDNRQSCDVLAVQRGEKIIIDFSTYTPVKGFYVTLDDKFALESGTSELNAWRSYKYENVGYTTLRDEVIKPTIFEGSRGVISIEDLGAILGDVIGFRVYAVNYDGTLVDPDGRAFYVSVGEVTNEVTMKEAATAHVNFIGGSYDKDTGVYTEGQWIFESDKIETIDGMKVHDIFNNVDWNSYSWYNYNNYECEWINETADADNQTPVFDVQYFDANDNRIEFSSSNKTKFAYLKFVFTKPMSFIDGATYTQTLTLKNRTNENTTTFDVRKITVSFVKTMPEIVPTYAKIAGQEEKQWLMPTDGNYYVRNNVKNGSLDFNNFVTLDDEVFSQWNPQDIGAQHLADQKGCYNFEVADGTYKYQSNGYQLAKLEVNPLVKDNTILYPMNVYNKPTSNVNNLILGHGQSDVKHAVSATYSYRNISKAMNENGAWKIGDYPVSAKSANQGDINIIYCSWTKDFSWKIGATDNWVKNKRNIVTWEQIGSPDQVELDLNQVEIEIKGNIVPSIKPNATSLGQLIADGYLAIIKSTVYGSDFDAYTKVGSQINPYFTVGDVKKGEGFTHVMLSQLSQDVMPPTAHDETLVFKVKDCFGCEFNIELPIKVQPK